MRTESKVRLVYVAGKFSAKTREGVEVNIAAAVAVALGVAELGCMPVCPHSNTAHPSFETIQPYTFWIAGTMELLRRCDAIVMVQGWEESSGARGELAEALRLGIPVFYSLAELAASIGHRSRPSHVAPVDDRPTEPAPPMSVAEFCDLLNDGQRDARAELPTLDDEDLRMVGAARGQVG